MKMKGHRVQVACYFDPDKVEKLKKLSKKTRVPVSVYIRDGVDLVLKKEKA